MDITGSMDRVVLVRNNTPVTVPGGGSTDLYPVLVTTRGRIRPAGGSRTGEYGEIKGNASFTILVRYQVVLWNNLSMSIKFESEGEIFTMQSWERKNDGRKSFILFNVTLQKNG